MQEGRRRRAQGRRHRRSSPTPGREKDRASHTRIVYLRAKNRDVLEKFFAGLTGELAVPADREIRLRGDQQARSEGGDADAGQAGAPTS